MIDNTFKILKKSKYPSVFVFFWKIRNERVSFKIETQFILHVMLQIVGSNTVIMCLNLEVLYQRVVKPNKRL